MKNIGVPYWEQPLDMWDTVNNVGLRYELCFLLLKKKIIQLQLSNLCAFVKKCHCCNVKGFKPCLKSRIHCISYFFHFIYSFINVFTCMNKYTVRNEFKSRNHYLCAVHAAKLMVPRKKGLIINISSAGGLRYLFNVPYGIGKEAVSIMALASFQKENIYMQ